MSTIQRQSLAPQPTLAPPASITPISKHEISDLIAAHQQRRRVLMGERLVTQPTYSDSVKYTQVAARVAARFAQAPSYSETPSAGEQKPQAAELNRERSLPMRRKNAINSAVPGVAPVLKRETTKQLAASDAIPPASAGLFDSIDWLQIMVADVAQKELQEALNRQRPARIEMRSVPTDSMNSMDSLFPEPTGMPLFDAALESLQAEPKASIAGCTAGPSVIVKSIQIEEMQTAVRQARMDVAPFPQQVQLGEGSEELPAEAIQSIAANLIDSPRELVAVRKARPRLAEGPLAAMDEGQLSIFEIQPATIIPLPEIGGLPELDAQTAQSPTWSLRELDALPQPDALSLLDAYPQSATVELVEPPLPVISVQPAPWSQRTLAAVMDMALTLTASLFVAFAAALNAPAALAPRTLEVSALLLVAIVGALYQGLSALLLKQTPGMWYANLRLATLKDETPTREQLKRRFGSLILSLLPMGLGVTWALFDADRLCWHDRISGTYPRKAV